MRDFAGHKAVVTGASSGIGRAIALELASRGAALSIVGRNRETLEDVASCAAATGAAARSYTADLASDSELQALVASLHRDMDGLDILVHSAGAISLGLLEDAPIEDLDRQYRTNVRAPYLLTQAVLPLVKRCRGQIVFINSSAGLTARPAVSQYAATKHALKAIADSLRAEVNACGVRVLSIYPGRTATAMQAAVHEMEGKVYQPERFMQPEDVAAAVVQALLLERTAEVTDISLRPFHKFD